MAAPAVAIAPVSPWADAQKDAVIEIARAVEAARGTGVGSVVVVTVRANRRRSTYVDGDLCVGLWRQDGNSKECRCAEERLPSTLKEFAPGLADFGHFFKIRGGAGWASDFHFGPPMRDGYGNGRILPAGSGEAGRNLVPLSCYALRRMGGCSL
jgi:hypothetical protein